MALQGRITRKIRKEKQIIFIVEWVVLHSVIELHMENVHQYIILYKFIQFYFKCYTINPMNG